MVCGDTEMQAVLCCIINASNIHDRVGVGWGCCHALAACKYWSYTMADISSMLVLLKQEVTKRREIFVLTAVCWRCRFG